MNIRLHKMIKLYIYISPRNSYHSFTKSFKQATKRQFIYRDQVPLRELRTWFLPRCLVQGLQRE